MGKHSLLFAVLPYISLSLCRFIPPSPVSTPLFVRGGRHSCSYATVRIGATTTFSCNALHWMIISQYADDCPLRISNLGCSNFSIGLFFGCTQVNIHSVLYCFCFNDSAHSLTWCKCTRFSYTTGFKTLKLLLVCLELSELMLEPSTADVSLLSLCHHFCSINFVIIPVWKGSFAIWQKFYIFINHIFYYEYQSN